MDPVEQLRALASEAAIRSVPKLLKTALGEGIPATRKQAEEALKERVPAQVLHPPPRSSGKVAAESPESRYACDLIDFSQNTADPGYILVLMQTWSRKLWCAPMRDKTAQQTNEAMRQLLQEAQPKPNQTHVLLHDAGQEFSQIAGVLPGNWVSTVKDPLDRQGIASLDKAIQTLKSNLEDIIEEKGGDWRTHLQAAVAAYNRSFNSAVLGPPSKAEDGAAKQFLLEQKNAQNIFHDGALAHRRAQAVRQTEHFREATGAKRGFNQQYGPKLHLEEVMPGGQYVKGSDGQLHLLKRVIPVHPNSGEPRGKLTQPRQYLHDTLRDLAEDLHAELIGHPRSLEEVTWTMTPRLHERGAKIKVYDFIRKFSDLFKLEGTRPVVHALVASHAPPRAQAAVEVKPLPRQRSAPVGRSSHGGSSSNDPNPGRSSYGGSSGSNDPPSRSSQLATIFRGETAYVPKRTAAEIAEQARKKQQAEAEKEQRRKERIDRSVALELERQQKRLGRVTRRNP